MGCAGKVVHHKCGYPLWSFVMHRFDETTLVNYRDGGSGGFVVFLCPGCGKPLPLWWSVPGQKDEWQAVRDECESECEF